MPVRKETAPAPEPQAEVSAEPAQADGRTTLYTEKELMNAKVPSLTAALAEMNVDPSGYEGRNTHKKLRDLVAHFQVGYLETHGQLPEIVLEDPKDLDMPGAATPPPAPATPPPAAAPVAAPAPAEESTPEAAGDLFAASTILSATEAPIGSVTYEAGVTINMGNFDSRRVTASMTLKVNATPEELAQAEETMQVVRESVMRRLNTEIAAIKKPA